MVGFGAVILLLVLDLTLGGSWNGWYFRRLPAVYQSSLRLSSVHALPLSIPLDALSNAVASPILAPMLFHKMTPDEYAFREPLFGFSWFHYSPLMHGHVLVDRRSGTASVFGRINLFPFGFAILFLSATASIPTDSIMRTMFFAVLLAIFGILYSIQRSRYAKLSAFLEQESRRGEPSDAA